MHYEHDTINCPVTCDGRGAILMVVEVSVHVLFNISYISSAFIINTSEHSIVLACSFSCVSVYLASPHHRLSYIPLSWSSAHRVCSRKKRHKHRFTIHQSSCITRHS